MNVLRLRNLTTGILHTDISCVHQDLEFITGMTGIMTHMLPNVNRAILPWLKEKVTDDSYWDDKYSPNLTGDYPIEPMNESERREMIKRYKELKNPLESFETMLVLDGMF